jgi:ribose transport system ATP-binding protein
MNQSTPQPWFRADLIGKAFPGVQALSEVGLDLYPGEVHALVGENGAGKSTLSRIIIGLETPDTGSMTLAGKRYQPTNKKHAETQGVRMVMQELNLIANLTVAENIFLENLPHRCGVIQYSQLNRQAAQLMTQVGLVDMAPTTPVKSLGTGQQQMVEIAAALSQQCRLLILDEPTASLTDKEIELLFTQIRTLKARGVSILYISHRMEEIKQIADRVTVLRDGKRMDTLDVAHTTIENIIRLMVGREVQSEQLRKEKTLGAVALKVVDLIRGELVRHVSFEVRVGEILGFAGLMGSGRTETMRTLFGADPSHSGQIFLHGSDRPIQIRTPRDAVRQGIAFLTEDRKEQGLFLPLPVRMNITLNRLSDVSRFGWIHPQSETFAAKQYADALSVRCSSLEQIVNHLSGGNQQKVVIAKWLYRNCDILIFDEPTRGIDVGAKFEIYRLLAELAAKGKAIIIVSSEMEELMALCDRIAVMSDGRLVRTLAAGEWSKETILEAAYQEYLKPTLPGKAVV